jgi:hypothetical protein
MWYMLSFSVQRLADICHCFPPVASLDLIVAIDQDHANTRLSIHHASESLGDGCAYREYGPRDEAATNKGVDIEKMKTETIFPAR